MTYKGWGQFLLINTPISATDATPVWVDEGKKQYADWTADREALQAEVTRQHLGWTDTYEQLDDAARDAGYQRRHREWALRAAREWMHTYRAHGKSLQAEVKRLREALGECCDLSGRCAAKYGALTLAEGELKRLRKILRRWSDKEKA